MRLFMLLYNIICNTMENLKNIDCLDKLTVQDPKEWNTS